MRKLERKKINNKIYTLQGNNNIDKLMYLISQILRLDIDETHIDQHLMT